MSHSSKEYMRDYMRMRREKVKAEQERKVLSSFIAQNCITDETVIQWLTEYDAYRNR